MFRNYVLISLRNLAKYKTFSLLNIMGLAVGMGCLLLISILVIDEISYEKFHLNAGRIYRIVTEDYIGTPAALAPVLKQNLPEISETVRFDNFTRREKKLFSIGDKKFYENRFVLADPSIFNVFSFFFIEGNPETALNTPNSILLTKTAAEKYFGKEDPIGKTLILENRWNFTVTGILEDIPDNTHMKFDVLAPFSFNEREDRYGKDLDQNWSQSNFVTYFLGAENSNSENAFLEEKINRIYVDSGRSRPGRQLFLQSLKKIHLTSNLAAEFEANSSVRDIVFFSVIGVIILVIACLNSVNLSTALSFKRAKEVGIRKVVGAERSQLNAQFFGESFVISAIALIAAIILITLFLPVFNSLTGKNISLMSADLKMLGMLIITVTITTAGSGIYPALFLSSFQPVKVIKSMAIPRSEGSLLRKILVVIQFSLSIIFLICTFIVWSQLNFIRKTNLGIKKEHIVNIPLHLDVREKYELIKNDIRQNQSVISATASNFPALSPYHHSLLWEGMTEDDDKSMFWFGVDHDFIDTLGLELIEGRNFSREMPTDTVKAYIFNESAVREFGKEFVKGRKFNLFGDENFAQVIGVAKDFHFMSLHEEIAPLVICIFPRFFNHISIRINSQDIPSALAHLREVWKTHIPNRPFEYFFLDDKFDRIYKSEQRLGKLFSYFAILAIFISCLGLFALASFMAEQRTKEIGVRKVLGASIISITALLSKEFLKWVMLANIIAWPIAYYFMKKWLDNFAYRTSIGIEVFFLSGLIALGIAQLTVSYQAIKAALSNPVKTLKYE
jgi:ABC-type antimicrobial peptide transport system permease subunit